MSVHGEFQRYLNDLVAQLAARNSDAALIEALERAQPGPTRDLSQSAQRVLEMAPALEAAASAARSPGQGEREDPQATCESLLSIAHIVVGR